MVFCPEQDEMLTGAARKALKPEYKSRKVTERDAMHVLVSPRSMGQGRDRGNSRAPRRRVAGNKAMAPQALDVPEDDQFMTITGHDAADFRYGASCLGGARSDDLVFIQITGNDSRTIEQQKDCREDLSCQAPGRAVHQLC
jgi:hypothetical protein